MIWFFHHSYTTHMIIIHSWITNFDGFTSFKIWSVILFYTQTFHFISYQQMVQYKVNICELRIGICHDHLHPIRIHRYQYMILMNLRYLHLFHHSHIWKWLSNLFHINISIFSTLVSIIHHCFMNHTIYKHPSFTRS